jgi:hypothetical protein
LIAVDQSRNTDYTHCAWSINPSHTSSHSSPTPAQTEPHDQLNESPLDQHAGVSRHSSYTLGRTPTLHPGGHQRQQSPPTINSVAVACGFFKFLTLDGRSQKRIDAEHFFSRFLARAHKSLDEASSAEVEAKAEVWDEIAKLVQQIEDIPLPDGDLSNTVREFEGLYLHKRWMFDDMDVS